MRNTFLKNVPVLLAILFCTSACKDNSKPDDAGLLAAAAAGAAAAPCTHINFIDFAQPLSDMQMYSANFLKNYKVRHGSMLISIDDTRTKTSEYLTVEHLEYLKSDVPSSGDEDKAGLKLYYAVDTTAGNPNVHRFYVVYKPVLLQKIEPQPLNSLDYQVNENINTSYYILDGAGNLQAINFFGGVLPKTNMYDTIFYHKNAAGNYESVIIDPDPMSVLYPFEEIDSLIVHNQELVQTFNLEMEKNYNSFIDKYEIKSISGVVFHHIEGKNKRHNIYLEPKPDASFTSFQSLFQSGNKQDVEVARIASGIFTGKIANLGSLCPPNCPTVSFPCK